MLTAPSGTIPYRRSAGSIGTLFLKSEKDLDSDEDQNRTAEDLGFIGQFCPEVLADPDTADTDDEGHNADDRRT